MKHPRRKVLKSITGAGALGLAGCTGDNGDGNGNGNGNGGNGNGNGGTDEYWDQMDERLKEAAELAPDEPEFVLYFNYRPAAFETMMGDFADYCEEEHGFRPEMDFFRAAAASVASRVESERRSGELNASYIGISGPGIILDWAQRGWLHEWLPPQLQNYSNDIIHPNDYMHTGTWWMPMNITVGPDVVDGNVPRPEGFAQMVFMEEMCQNMTSYDFLLGGGASWYHTTYMHKKITEGQEVAGMDTPTWGEYVEQFYGNEPFLSPSSFNMIQQVGRGEYAAHLQSLAGWSKLLQEEDGVPVEDIYPETGTPMFFNAEGLFKDAPAINTAMLFQDWWLSEEVQQKFCEIEYCYSAHEEVEGIAATDSLPDLDSFPAELPPWREYAPQRRGVLDQIRFHADEAEPNC